MSVSQQTADDLEMLQSEGAKLKATLRNQYKDQLAKMIADATISPPISGQDARKQRLVEMLDNRTPLRREVKDAQAQAIARLVEESKLSADRGEDVGARLDLLLNMKAEMDRASSSPAATPVKLSRNFT